MMAGFKIDPRLLRFGGEALQDLGYGLAKAPTIGQAFGVASQRMVEAQPARDAYAASEAAKAERLAQINQTSEYLRNTFPDLAEAVSAGMPLDAAWSEAMKRKQPGYGQQDVAELPANIREWNTFSAMTQEQQQQYLTMKRANPYLDLGTGFGQPNPVVPGALNGPVIPKNGNVPTGFQQTAPGEIAPMPGSEPDRERQAGKVKAESAINTLEQKNAIAVSAIDAAMSQVSGWNTGNVMGNMGGVPVLGQGALDLGKTLDTIKANIGFEELQTMRDNSPTGGALGSITERELAFLQSTIASIEQSQSEDQLKRNLKTLRDFLSKSQAQRRQAYEQQYGGSGSQAPAGGGNYVFNPATGKLEPQ